MNFFAINIPEAVLTFVLLIKGGMLFKDDQVHPDFGVFRAELKWVVKKIHQYLQETCRVPLQAFEKHGIVNPILRWYQLDVLFLCDVGDHQKSVIDHFKQWKGGTGNFERVVLDLSKVQQVHH